MYASISNIHWEICTSHLELLCRFILLLFIKILHIDVWKCSSGNICIKQINWKSQLSELNQWFKTVVEKGSPIDTQLLGKPTCCSPLLPSLHHPVSQQGTYHDYSSPSFGILLFVIFLHKHLRLSPVFDTQIVSLSHISFSWQSSSYFLLPRWPHSVPLAKKWIFILTTQLCGFPKSIYTDGQVAGEQRDKDINKDPSRIF